MISLNRVSLIGNLGHDPELRFTSSQIPWLTLRLATSESRRNANGEPTARTDWHRVVVWNRMAERCASSLAKGRPIFVEGRLQTRSWEDKTGSRRFITEIVADTVEPIGVRDQAGNPTLRLATPGVAAAEGEAEAGAATELDREAVPF